MTVTASAINAVSISVSWNFTNNRNGAYLDYTVSGPGMTTVTGQLYTGQTASGSATATGLSPNTSYTYTADGQYADGQAFSGGSATKSTQGYTSLSPSISYSGGVSGTLSWSAGTDSSTDPGGGNYGVSNPTYTIKQNGTTIASAASNSGSQSLSLAYSTSYTWNYTQTGTSNGYTFTRTASTSYTTGAAPSYPPAWVDQTLGAFQASVAYSDGVSATNMNYSGTYSVSLGALPSGISLNTTTGAVTGTPTSGGQAYSFTIKAQNSYGNVTKAFSGTVAAPPDPTAWTDTTLANFVVNRAYSDAVSASNGATYSVSAGSLPTGISLNTSTGELTGTPTGNTHAYSFTLSATNGVNTVTQSYSGYVGGLIYYYNGSAWATKVATVYNGSSWVNGTVYIYNGTSWVPSI